MSSNNISLSKISDYSVCVCVFMCITHTADALQVNANNKMLGQNQS